MKRLITALAILAMIPSTLWGQDTGSSSSKIYGPGVLTIGNAFYLTGTHITAANSNNLAESSQLRLGYHRFTDDAMSLELSSGGTWWPGAFTIGIRSLTYQSSTEGKIAELWNDEAELFEGGTEMVSELALGIGSSRRIFKIPFTYGAKLAQVTVGNQRDIGAAFDVGVTRNVRLGTGFRAKQLILGVAGENLGSDLRIDGNDIALPSRVTATALSQGWQVGPLDVGAGVAVSRRRDREVIPAGAFEFSYYPYTGRTFYGKLGARRVPSGSGSPVTFGAAFRGDRVTVEYNYRGYGDPGGAHSILLQF